MSGAGATVFLLLLKTNVCDPRSCELSGIAMVLTAPVQRHVMGHLVIKQLRNSLILLFAVTCRTGRTVANCQFTTSHAGNKCIQYNCKWVYTNSLLFVQSFYTGFAKEFWMNCDSSSYNEEKRQHHLWARVRKRLLLAALNRPLLLAYRGALSNS